MGPMYTMVSDLAATTTIAPKPTTDTIVLHGGDTALPLRGVQGRLEKKVRPNWNEEDSKAMARWGIRRRQRQIRAQPPSKMNPTR